MGGYFGTPGSPTTPPPNPFNPTYFPTRAPTSYPTTFAPTYLPTTANPSFEPTTGPSAAPSTATPSAVPSTRPSPVPTQAPTPGPTPVPFVTVGLSFFNGIQNNETYFLAVTDYQGNVWTTSAVAYGASLQFSKTVPFPLSTTGDKSGYAVLRARDNATVAKQNPFPIDNVNSQLVVAWTDAQQNIYSDSVGMYGGYNSACFFALNFAYPFQSSSSTTPTVSIVPNNGLNTIGDNTNAAAAQFFSDFGGSTSSAEKTYSGSGKVAATATYAGASSCIDYNTIYNFAFAAGANTQVLDISGWGFYCGTSSDREKLAFTAPTGTGVRTGTSTFFICLNDPKLQTNFVNPAAKGIVARSVPSTASRVPHVAASVTSLASTISTGYLAEYEYAYTAPSNGVATCRDLSQVTFHALGRCVQTGMRTSLIRSASLDNGVVSFLGLNYASTDCNPKSAGPAPQYENLKNTTVCRANRAKTSSLTARYLTSLPKLPAGQMAKYTYTSAAQCAAGATPLKAEYYPPSMCATHFGDSYQLRGCAPNVTLASTTGGFVIHKYYAAAGCQDAPLVTNFYQLNVCGQTMDTGSFKVVAKKPSSGSSVTAFQMVTYPSNDCSGDPSAVASVPRRFNATTNVWQNNVWQSNVIPEGDTSMICTPSGLANKNMAYVTVLYAPVAGFSSGWGVMRFNNLAGCYAFDATRLFGGTVYTSGCVQDAGAASNYVSLDVCGGLTTAPTKVTQTQSFQGVSLATAQSAAFQTNYALALAAYVGVSASSVSVTSLASGGGGGVAVNVAVVATSSNLAAVRSLLANAGPPVVNALSASIPGLSLASAPALPGTGPATPTSVSTALTSSGAALTASLSALFPGIVVSNAVTTVTATGVSAVQNIPSGVTVATAQTAAFQTSFIAAVASVAGVPASSVTGYTATQGRRLLAGVNVAYTVNTVTVGVDRPYVGACFAASERLTLEGGATKSIAEVAVGDRVLTVNAKTGEQMYSDVAYVPHGQNAVQTTFVTVATASGRDVKMTTNHVLPAGACDLATAPLPYISASSVSVGDCVETVSGRERVVSVSTAEGEGIYTAIAMEELLVVNGIVATPYGGVNPALANVYYNLHRLAYKAGAAWLASGWRVAAAEGLWRALFRLAGPSA